MIEIISYILIFIGSLCIITSNIGCNILPDFFTKMHAATIGDAIGCPVILVGLSLQTENIITTAKILILAVIILIINPTSSYILNIFALKQEEPLPEIKDVNNE